ncbi:MAG: ATP-binding cassette domain-containing protein [Bacilli bacterium]|nr:ATP-binding cassette domain-containing protein [Bacilli bacterium]
MDVILTNVSKKIEKEQVLQDVSFSLKEGMIYGLVGRNGSGKSMLLKTICGFIRPDKGSVLVDGIDIYKTNSFPKNTRALIERPNYLPDLTGYENLKMLASIMNKIGDEEIFNTLKKVNLFEEKDKKFKKYSLGMKQKLGIAQVLMEDPDLILLDEPFNGIEDESIEKIRKILLEEKRRGKLIIIATHIKEDIDELCDVIYKMSDGKMKE